jgi:hypothetical protein
MSHSEIAKWLAESGAVESGWWAQMVTVGYEQARGMRKVNERPDGFSLSVSRTMPFGLVAVSGAWTDPERRMAWLPESGKLEITTASPGKGARGRWADDGSRLIVAFSRKGDDRTQVVVQVERLKSESEVEPRREMWRSALAALQESLAAGQSA